MCEQVADDEEPRPPEERASFSTWGTETCICLCLCADESAEPPVIPALCRTSPWHQWRSFALRRRNHGLTCARCFFLLGFMQRTVDHAW